MNFLISLAYALASAAISSADTSISLKECREPVVTKCLCGDGEEQLDVYVQGCQVSLNDSLPCQPCPGACDIFQNCKTCSKYECLSCVNGFAGSTCENSVDIQTLSPNANSNQSDHLVQNSKKSIFQKNSAVGGMTESVKDDKLQINKSKIFPSVIKQSKISTHEPVSTPDPVSTHEPVSTHKRIKTNEPFSTLKRLSTSEPVSTLTNVEVKLNARNSPKIEIDTRSESNEPSPVPEDLTANDATQLPDTADVCQSNCSIDTNETINQDDVGYTVDDSQNQEAVVNASNENYENQFNSTDLQNDIQLVISDNSSAPPIELSIGDALSLLFEGSNSSDIRERLLKHRSPNPTLDGDYASENNETVNPNSLPDNDTENKNYDSKNLNTQIEPILQNSLLTESGNNTLEVLSQYIPLQTGNQLGEQYFIQNPEKVEILPNTRDIYAEYADKLIDERQKLQDQIYNFSEPHLLKRIFEGKENEAQNEQPAFPDMLKNLCTSFPSTYICRKRGFTNAAAQNTNEQPNLHIEHSMAYFRSPDYSGNGFLFKDSKPIPIFQDAKEENTQTLYEVRPSHFQESRDAVQRPSQQNLGDSVHDMKPKHSFYPNQEPNNLRHSEINSSLIFEKSLPNIIDHLMHVLSPYQARSTFDLKDISTEEVSGKKYVITSSDGQVNNNKSKNLYLLAHAPDSSVSNEYNVHGQNSNRKYHFYDPKKIPVVKGQFIVMRLGSGNGTDSLAPAEIISSRNFEFNIPPFYLDKKKSGHSKHGKGRKHSHKPKRHRNGLNEYGKKKCNPWKEDCTKRFGKELRKKLALVEKSKNVKNNASRPDRIRVKFMKHDNSSGDLISNSSQDVILSNDPIMKFRDVNAIDESFAISQTNLEEDQGKENSSTRHLFRTRRSTTNRFCPIPKETRHGDLDCTIWTYKKSCKLICHDGYSADHQQFTCTRSTNTWFPVLSTCTGHAYFEPSNNNKQEAYEEEEVVEDDAENAVGDDYAQQDHDNDEVVEVEDNGAELVENDDDDYAAMRKKTPPKKVPKSNHSGKKGRKRKAHVNSVNRHQPIPEMEVLSHSKEIKVRKHPKKIVKAKPHRRPTKKMAARRRIARSGDSEEDEGVELISAGDEDEQVRHDDVPDDMDDEVQKEEQEENRSEDYGAGGDDAINDENYD